MASLVSPPPATTNSVVFPPPPPTSNTLTSEQRAQLRKSTKKLGQILGATPHLLDTDVVRLLGPVHLQLPPRNESPSPVLSDSSVDSYSSRSSSSCSFYSHPYAACALLERDPSTPPPSRQGSLRIKSSSGRLDKSDAASKQAPTLRLAVSPPSPTTTSSLSSSPTKSSARLSLFDSHTRSNSLDEPSSIANSSSDMKFTLRPARHSTSVQSISEPSFNIPSPSTTRRQKMDRLRKMLGDEVPVHLVFPDQKQDNNTEHTTTKESEIYSTELRSFGIAPVAVAGTAIPRPKKTSAAKIMSARDSMGTLTPHRAKRQEKPKGTEKQLKSSPPPPPPIVNPTSATPKDPSEKLCVIVECPEEHGASVFEGFGFGGSSAAAAAAKKKKKATVVVQSSWRVRGGSGRGGMGMEDLNRVWSTRRGYVGWDRSVVVGKSEQERRKAMSYRKPPPPIDF